MPPARLGLYAATLAVIVLTARAALIGPPPLGWAIACLAGYVGLVLASVFWLRLQVFVDAVTRGPDGAQGVALTFDDGPHPTWTPRVLEILRQRGATATFFVIGQKAEAHPEVVRALVRAGHAVELHSHAHDRLFSLRSTGRVRADLERGRAAIEALTGSRPTLFRPPIGHTSPPIARAVEALDLTVVGWTVSGHDGLASAHPRDVVTRLRSGLRDGAILALHDAPERGDREPAAVRALPAVLDAIAAQGLDVVPLARWLGE
jgi:peptidoglycan/xylan/chitin deacetylase (PgdA/CDA1 family)